MATSEASEVRAKGQSVQGWTSIAALAKAVLPLRKACFISCDHTSSCRGLDDFSAP